MICLVQRLKMFYKNVFVLPPMFLYHNKLHFVFIQRFSYIEQKRFVFMFLFGRKIPFGLKTNISFEMKQSSSVKQCLKRNETFSLRNKL